MKQPLITVVGSANTDLTVTAAALPAPGETVLGGALRTAGGGKGANQAVAAARAGARVAFVGRVGADAFGQETRERLQREGIDASHLRTDEHEPTGVALIIVDGRGENLIAVAPGANGRVTADDVAAARDAVAKADVLLLQLEIPLEALRAAAEIAREAGKAVLLDPAPAPGRAEADQLLGRTDYVTPNRAEAARLLGARADEEPETLARGLCERGPRAAFVTLGPHGVCVCEGGACMRIAAPPVHPVDTVGAGDCFAAALAVALAEGAPAAEAARFAVCAAALAVQRAGAQPAMPARAEIERFRQSTDAV
jgi:ribokinase